MHDIMFIRRAYNNNSKVYDINHRSGEAGGGGCDRETKNCNVHARGKVIRLRCTECAALRLVVDSPPSLVGEMARGKVRVEIPPAAS